MARVLVSLCVLACACIKVPEFVPKDAPSGDGDAMTDGGGDGGPISIMTNGDGSVTVTGPGYTITFSNQGSRYPSQIDLGSNAVLGGSEHCADESGVGIAVYPSYRVNGLDATGMGAPTLEVPLDGPFVGQVRLGWTGSFSCGPNMGRLQGHSTFSFFPDGRITRFDTVHNETSVMATACDVCTPNGQSSSTFYLTSYTTLVVDTGIGATLTDGNLANLTTYGMEVPAGSSTCVSEHGYAIAFSWSGGNNRVRVAAAPPTSPARTLAFVHDMYTNASLPTGDWEVTTQMGITSQQVCPALESRISDFSNDARQVMIAGTPIGAALADGIYGGDPRTTGYPVAFPVTLSPAPTPVPRIPPGFAVWLQAPLPANLRLTHSAHTGTSWYREQRIGSDQILFWFDVSLEANDTITIEQAP